MTGLELTAFQWLIVGVGAAAVGTQAYAQYQAGQTAESQAKAQAAWHAYNAKVSQVDAKIARRDAEAERVASAHEAKQQKREGKMLLARSAAAIGASGVTAEGSPLLVMEDTAGQLALENAMIRMQGQQRVGAALSRAERFRSQSILDTYSGAMAKSRGSSAARAGAIGAGASLLSGASQIGFQAEQMRRT